MTSSASRLARYEAFECACMLRSAPRSLACCSMLLYVVVVEVRGFGGLVLRSLRNPWGMSVILVVWVLLSGLLVLICGHVRRPPMEGSASVKIMSGRVLPSTTLRAPLSAVSL
jgi:hypothetical protein